MKICAVLFDFGGVIAEEGFQQGLYAIAQKFGLDQKRFFQLANDAVYNSGYVTGMRLENAPALWLLMKNYVRKY